MRVGARRPLATAAARARRSGRTAPRVRGRVGPVDAAGQHRDRAAARGQRAPVGGGVDAVRAAGHDGPAALGQAVGRAPRRRGRRTPVLARAPTTATDRSHASASRARRATTGSAAGTCRAGSGRGPSTLIRARSSSWCGHSSSSGVTMRTAEPLGRGPAPGRDPLVRVGLGPAGPGRPRPAARRCTSAGPQPRERPRPDRPGPTSRPSSRLPGSTRWASAMRARRTGDRRCHRRSRPCAAPAPRSTSSRVGRRRDRRGPQWSTPPGAPGRSRGPTAIPGPAGWPGRP